MAERTCPCGAPAAPRKTDKGQPPKLCADCRKARRAERERQRNRKPHRRNRPKRLYHQTCAACGDGFKALSQRRYCSDGCRPGSAPKPLVCSVAYAECGFCGHTMVKRGPRRYCSTRCRDYSRQQRVLAADIEYGDCVQCGGLFVCRAGAKKRGRVYCTPGCSKAARRKADKRKRRLRLIDAPQDRYTLRQVADRDGWRCHLCGKAVPDRPYKARANDPTIDHLIPVSDGGSDTLDNVALAHNRCNYLRGAEGQAQLRLVG